MKLLSVIIPCYNQGHFLRDAIESVKQSDPNGICEIIVINDGSTDEKSIDILHNISIPDVYIHHQKNQGLAKARNKGIELSNCDHVLMLDADNKITSDFILTFEEELHKKTHFDAIHGNSLYFGEQYDQKKYIFKSQPLNIYKLSHGNYIDACAILCKKTLIELNGYDEKMPHMGLEDWDLWIRMAQKGKTLLYFDKVLFHYRISSDSMIRTLGKRDREVREYLVEKFDNVMFRENFYIQNHPFENFNDLKTLEIIKRLLKRLSHKLMRKK